LQKGQDTIGIFEMEIKPRLDELRNLKRLVKFCLKESENLEEEQLIKNFERVNMLLAEKYNLPKFFAAKFYRPVYWYLKEKLEERREMEEPAIPIKNILSEYKEYYEANLAILEKAETLDEKGIEKVIQDIGYEERKKALRKESRVF